MGSTFNGLIGLIILEGEPSLEALKIAVHV
jgi:hypothetical protein